MTDPARSTARARRGVAAFLGAVVVCVAIGSVAGQVASSEPDGLERVAEDQGFLGAAEEHDLASSPVAGYELDGVGGGVLASALAGAGGVALTLLVGWALLGALRRRRSPADDPAP